MTRIKLQQKIKHITLLLASLLAVSCSNSDVYFKYHDVETAGWSKDSSFVYEFSVEDTVANYNLYVNVRNRGEYPHQNLWLFITELAPDSVITCDTINFYLADQRGKWLGSGIGSTYEMPVLYRQAMKFPKSGAYRFEIAHGMRDEVLIGLNDVGFRVEKLQ